METRHGLSQLLFLCSGNYYRSRFAEMLFNTHVRDKGVPWTAFSRGLVVDRLTTNIGPISSHTVRGLAARGIVLSEQSRFPVQLHEQDLVTAHIIIALKEVEHRPMLTQRFPGWPDRVEYWHIDDVDGATPAEALAAIEREVLRLLSQLSGT